MSTHNICFCWEIRKLFTWYPLLSRHMDYPQDMFWYKKSQIFTKSIGLPGAVMAGVSQNKWNIMKIRFCFWFCTITHLEYWAYIFWLKKYKTRASWWRTIACTLASAIAYHRAHQNSKCFPLVLIHRAITCDSFKVLAQKAYEESCDNPKKGPKIFLTSNDPQTCPWGKIFAPPYFTLHYLWFDMQHEHVCIKWTLDHSGPHPPALPPRVTLKFRMCSFGPHP